MCARQHCAQAIAFVVRKSVSRFLTASGRIIVFKFRGFIAQDVQQWNNKIINQGFRVSPSVETLRAEALQCPKLIIYRQ
jgi:hypothetical protein